MKILDLHPFWKTVSKLHCSKVGIKELYSMDKNYLNQA